MELTAPFHIGHALQPLVPELRKLRNRRALLQSPLWAAHGPELVRVSEALEYHQQPALPLYPSRPFVRVAAWNIERGKRFAAVMEGLRDARLRSADVVILNEVDVGMARSGQRHIARLVADELRMHYVFGNHYLCLDRGNVRDAAVLGRDGALLNQRDDLTENRLGLHGNVILSRFPLLRAENVPLHQTKDKFASRSEKRLGVKKGLWADVQTPLGVLRVAAVHLDSVASPEGRAKQLRDLLLRLEGPTPALVGGDWNTTTYDLQSPWRLLRNLLAKFARGGFAHAVPEYMRPYRIYEKPVFDVAEARGFDWSSFNALDHSTMVYDVDDPENAQAVRERVGAFGVKVLRRRLAPWNGRAPLKVDWFAGRGCHAAKPDPATGALGPRSLEGFRPLGQKASDHYPILVDVVF